MKPAHLLKNTVKRILRRFGYRLVPTRVMEQYVEGSKNPYLASYLESDQRANPEYDRAGDDLLKERRFFTLYQMVQHVIKGGIPGDFAECGCKHGHSSYIIAKELLEEGRNRDLYLFDSFEGGLSDKQEEDRTTRLGNTDTHKTKAQKERFSSSYEHVKKVFSDMPFVHLVKGWLPHTLCGDVADKHYAFVHLDVDLYEPTKASLEFFYDRLTEGGVIVVDDYGSATFPGARTAVQEFLSDNPSAFFHESQLMGCFLIKQ